MFKLRYCLNAGQFNPDLNCGGISLNSGATILFE
tara:strand:+ start:1024 stop:1125 length:102 start_codon:yes stop_codon:yes gene_type:complete